MSSGKIRLLLHGAQSAARNMATDEALLQTARGANDPDAIVLRIYQWEEPAYSIGYFQKIETLKKFAASRGENFPIVRRMTGGGAVRHGQDLTFSLCARMPNPLIPSDVRESYLKINDALRAGFLTLEPALDFADCRSIPSGRAGVRALCFEAPSCFDLLLNGRKIVGASQRRVGGAVLYQSSILLNRDPRSMIEAMLNGFQKKWAVEFETSQLDAQESALVARVESERYESPDWCSRPFSREAIFFS